MFYQTLLSHQVWLFSILVHFTRVLSSTKVLVDELSLAGNFGCHCSGSNSSITLLT